MARPKSNGPSKPGRHGQNKIGDFTIGSHVNDLKEFDFYNQFLGGALFREETAKALKHAALLVKKSVLEQVRQSFPQASNEGGFRYVGGGRGYKLLNGSTKKYFSDTMEDAVRVGRLKGGFNHQELTVHIMGTRASSSGTYRLRFYEEGGPRQYRGSIPGYHFFRRGRKQVNVWFKVKEHIDNYLKSLGWV